LCCCCCCCLLSAVPQRARKALAAREALPPGSTLEDWAAAAGQDPVTLLQQEERGAAAKQVGWGVGGMHQGMLGSRSHQIDMTPVLARSGLRWCDSCSLSSCTLFDSFVAGKQLLQHCNAAPCLTLLPALPAPFLLPGPDGSLRGPHCQDRQVLCLC
jgi:hypothetical protein